MKKRKQTGMPRSAYKLESEGMNSPSKKNDLLYGKVHGRRPAARDGHTGIVVGDLLIVFGGDRHHMPFNDTSVLDLRAELKENGL